MLRPSRGLTIAAGVARGKLTTVARSLGEALARFYAAEGQGPSVLEAEALPVRFGPVRISLPNPRFQRELLARHDAHHVLGDFDTSLAGEAQVGAWELAAGSGHWFVLLNNLLALPLGLLAPRATVRAFRRGRRCRSLHRHPASWEQLLTRDVDELRRELGLGGLPTGPSGATTRE